MPGRTLPLIQEFFSLRELLSAEELVDYAVTPVGRLIFWDDQGLPIEVAEGTPSPDFELCREVEQALHGPDACHGCPLLDRPRTTGAQQVTCANTVLNIIAAVVVEGRVIGYVLGPQCVEQGYYSVDFKLVSHLDSYRWALSQRNVLLERDKSEVSRAVGRAAEGLSRRCALERRLRILKDGTTRMAAAKKPEDVLDHTFQSLTALFGRLECSYYVRSEKRTIELKRVMGPHEAWLPKSVAESEHSASIHTGMQQIWKTLEGDEQQYMLVRPDVDPPTRAILTVPMRWGIEQHRGALQVKSPNERGLRPGDRKAILALVSVAEVAAAKVSLDQERSTFISKPLEAGAWFELLLELTAPSSASGFDVFQAKHKLYRGLAEEARRQVNAQAASVRWYDPIQEVLRFVACDDGPWWTAEHKELLYRRGERSAGMLVFDTGEALYLEIIDEKTKAEGHYKEIFPGTQSLYTLPLRMGTHTIGVLSLDWDQPHGRDSDRERLLKSLVRQFENVLGVLGSREESLFRQFESSLPGKPGARELEKEIGREWVEATRQLIRARACSLLLTDPEMGDLRLVNTTAVMPPSAVTYIAGEGLTGWVAANRRPLRLKNAADRAEIQRHKNLRWTHKWSEEIFYGDSGSRSFLAAPLIAEAELIGVIRLTIKDDLSDFTPGDEALLCDVASRMARSIRTSWVEQEATATLQRMQDEVQRRQSYLNAGGLQGICQVLVEQFMQSTKAVGALLVLRDPDTGLSIQTAAGLFKSVLAGSPALLDRDLSGYRSEPEGQKSDNFLADVSSISAWHPILERLKEAFKYTRRPAIHSGASLPLTIGGERLGCLTLAWREKQAFDAQQKLALQNMAKQASAVKPFLSELRAHAELKRRMEEMQSLREIGSNLSPGSDVVTLLDTILSIAIREAGMERGTIRIYDDVKDMWKLKAPSSELAPIDIQNNPILRRSHASEFAINVPNVSDDPDWIGYRDSVADSHERQYLFSIVSSLHIPIRSKNKCAGLILLDASRQVQIKKETCWYLEILAQYVAIAIDFEQILEERTARTFLYETAAMLKPMLEGLIHHLNRVVESLGESLLVEHSSPDTLTKNRDNLNLVVKKLEKILRMSVSSFGVSVNLKNIIRDALAFYSDRAFQSRVEFLFDKGDAIEVCGDDTAIEIILQMIIQNAIEAMAVTGGKLTIRTQPGRHIEIHIKDTGPGMNAETLSKAGTSGFTTKPNGGGRGLSIADRLMTLCQGTMSFESAPGQGTTVTLRFPLKEDFKHGENSVDR